MSGPEGQLSSVTDDESSLTGYSSVREVSDFLPDTSTYFAAWAESVRPSLIPEDDPVPATVSFPQTSNDIENSLPQGEFTWEGSLRIDCYIKGIVSSRIGTLIVCETGEVEADIFVPTAIIDGLVRGNIRATDRVELRSKTGEVDGDIFVPIAIIDGLVRGNIRATDRVELRSKTGKVDGDVFVPIAIIDGLVRGNIRATERVELGSNARVIGNIETPALSIQPGAIFEGQCHFLSALSRSNVQDNGQEHAADATFPMPSSLEFPSTAQEEVAKPLAIAVGR